MNTWNGIKPTENGWYWYRHNPECTPLIVLVQQDVVYSSLPINGRTSIPLSLFPPGLWSHKLQPPMTDAEMVEHLESTNRNFSSMLSEYEAPGDS